MEFLRAAITGIGHYVPPDIRDNRYFGGQNGVSEEWIFQRTGIRERRILAAGGTSDLVVPAAHDCLRSRGLGANDVDCVIVATITPDHIVPSTAAIVQHRLGAEKAWGFDLSAACAGFPYALNVAASLVTSKAARRVLVCAADKMSTLANEDHPSTAVLFGDAGTAVLVELTTEPELGLIDVTSRSQCDGLEQIYVSAGGSVRPASAATIAAREHYLVLNGPRVFKAAVAEMVRQVTELMARNGLTTSDVKWLVPHQANRRIIDAVGEELGFSPEKVMVNVDRYGNTSAATIPLCLSEWHQSGRLQVGDEVIIVSFGAGYAVGAAYLRWSMLPSDARRPGCRAFGQLAMS